MIERTTRNRPCKQCPTVFEDRGPGKRNGIPAGFCSLSCHAQFKREQEDDNKQRRATPLVTRASTQKRRPISPASTAQRAAVEGKACLVCRRPGPCHPAHIVDRSLLGEDQDHELAVIWLCAQECHRAYDDGDLSILEYLEPHHRDRLGFAVARFGLLRTLERVTNQRWAPADDNEDRRAA